MSKITVFDTDAPSAYSIHGLDAEGHDNGPLPAGSTGTCEIADPSIAAVAIDGQCHLQVDPNGANIGETTISYRITLPSGTILPEASVDLEVKAATEIASTTVIPTPL